jgi:hypothetical protein
MEFSATLSEDGAYRYRLARRWSSRDAILWLMLNPSTADASTDDPTIRRVADFSQRWGYGKAMVGNIFALRSTDPDELLTHPSPVGPLNGWHLKEMAAEASVIVCAWGAHKAVTPDRWHVTLSMLGWPPGAMLCLGHTKSGAPKHPLYLPKTTLLQAFRPPVHR